MPAYTRSQNARYVDTTLTGERWTRQEDRSLIRMLRHANASVTDAAKALHRSPKAVHYRINHILKEHLGNGAVSLSEASEWLHPHISARDMSEDFAAHIVTFTA